MNKFGGISSELSTQVGFRKLIFPDCRHEQNIAIIRNACAAEMCVRKAVDDVVGIVIARTAVPVVGARVGRELDHPERHRRPGKCMPVAAGADERVDPSGEVACLGGGDDRQNKNYPAEP